MTTKSKSGRRKPSQADLERGQRILELAADQQWTQVRFGEEIGLSKNSMTSLVKGYTTPGTETLQRICERFRVFPEWVLFGRGPKRLPPGTPVPKVVASLPTKEHGHRDLARWMNGTTAGRTATVEEKRFLKSMDWPADERIPDAAFALALRAYREIRPAKRNNA